MRAAGEVTLSKAIPTELQAAFLNPDMRLDSKRGIAAAARRILVASGHITQEVAVGLDRRRDSVQRADALTVAFARELEDVLKEVFEAEYPELRAPEFMPERRVAPMALTFTYRMTDRLGFADVIDENGSNIPKVDVKGEEWQQPIVTIGAAYDLTLFDQMRGGMLGISIDALKAESARWAIEYKIEQLAALGDASQGLVGIWNAPGVNATTQVSKPAALSGTVSVTNGSASITFSGNQTLAAGQIVTFLSQPNQAYVLLNAVSASTSGTLTQPYSGTTNASTTTYTGALTWLAQISSIAVASVSNATPPAVVVTQQIAADLGAMIKLIYQQSNGMYEPDTCLIPAQLYQALKITPQSPGFNSKSILQYLEELTGLDFEMWPQLNAANAAGTNGVNGVVVVYKKDPRILNLMTAMDFTQLPPQLTRMSHEIVTYARTGAAQVRYPLAVTYLLGVC